MILWTSNLDAKGTADSIAAPKIPQFDLRESLTLVGRLSANRRPFFIPVEQESDLEMDRRLG